MVACYPFETISIDVTGPHPRSANGFVSILMVVDHYSKFAFAFPTRNQEATTVAKILIDNVICLVGTPARILSDQGPNFESLLFKELCRVLRVAKIRTSLYEASTNGMVERFNLTLNSILAKKREGNLAGLGIASSTCGCSLSSYTTFGNLVDAELHNIRPRECDASRHTPV